MYIHVYLSCHFLCIHVIGFLSIHILCVSFQNTNYGCYVVLLPKKTSDTCRIMCTNGILRLFTMSLFCRFVCLAYVTTSQVEGSPCWFPFHFVLPLCQIAKRPWGLIKVCSVVTLYCLRMSDCALLDVNN